MQMTIGALRARLPGLAEQMRRGKAYLDYLERQEGKESKAYVRYFDFWEAVRREYEQVEAQVAAMEMAYA